VTTDDAREQETELHLLLGAFVLGGLDAEDHRAFTRHLRTCASCQREAAQFSGLPALLDLASPQDEGSDHASPDVPARQEPPSATPIALLHEVRRRRRVHRWRLAAAAAVLALVAGGLGAMTGPVLDRLNAPPTAHVVAAPAASGSAAVEIDLVSRGWGTQLDVSGSGLPRSGVLYLWVTNTSGRSYSVASWTGTPSGRTTLTAACWMKSADIRQIEVRTSDGAALATAKI
jgi:anti-sigma-K factor RskA